ncbi:hypothetical protein ABK040_009223 [Willaertia magna]
MSVQEDESCLSSEQYNDPELLLTRHSKIDESLTVNNKTKINDLPIEVITDIFKNLDVRSLINVMTTNFLFFQISINFILSGNFNNSETLLSENNLLQQFQDEQLKYYLENLLFIKRNDLSVIPIDRIDLTNFKIVNSTTIELIKKFIIEFECNELLIDSLELINSLLNIIPNLTYLKLKDIDSEHFLNYLVENKDKIKLKHLYMEKINSAFRHFNIFKSLKSLSFTLHINDGNKENGLNFFTDGFKYMTNIEELNINFLLESYANFNINYNLINSLKEGGKNLKRLSFIKLKHYTTTPIYWNFPKLEHEKNTIFNYLKEKPIFPNLKDLILNLELDDNGKRLIKYFIKKNTNLDKLTINYKLYTEYDKLLKRIDNVNEFTINGDNYSYTSNYDSEVEKKLLKRINIDKLIIEQITMRGDQFIKLLDDTNLVKEIYLLDKAVVTRFNNPLNTNDTTIFYNNYNSDNLNQLNTIYLSKAELLNSTLQFLISKSESTLRKLYFYKSEFINDNYYYYSEANVLQELENIKQLKEIKTLNNLRYLRIDNCKGDYTTVYLNILKYNLAQLDKLFLINLYYISSSLIEFTFKKVNVAKLIELDLYGSPFDDNLLIKYMKYQNEQFNENNRIKLCLEGTITERGLLAIPKEVRKRIVELKLMNSAINLNDYSKEIIEFLNDLSDELTVCCLNFRQYGPTKEVLQVISKKFKELKILNIQGTLQNEIVKEDVINLVNELEKIELVYLDCINNFPVKEVEEFRNAIRLQKRSAPKLIIPVKLHSSSKDIVRNTNSKCLIC